MDLKTLRASLVDAHYLLHNQCASCLAACCCAQQHALEVDSSTELLLQGPVQPTAEHQKALEQHWRGVRALTGLYVIAFSPFGMSCHSLRL
jgi:hypothetical protein